MLLKTDTFTVQVETLSPAAAPLHFTSPLLCQSLPSTPLQKREVRHNRPLAGVSVLHEDELVDERHVVSLVMSQNVPHFLRLLVVHLVVHHVSIIVFIIAGVRLQEGVGRFEGLLT